MKSNLIYILLASPRSVAPSLLRWTLAAALFLEIARTALWAAGIVQWQVDPVLKAFSNNLFPFLATPFAISRIVVGAGLLMGFFTRIWAILTVFLAVLGYQTMHGVMEDHIYLLEHLVVVCGAALALVVLGGGRGSLDKAISGHLLPRIG